MKLRLAILRKPLGLGFSDAELAAESDSIHLGCWQGERLLGCLVLKPGPGSQLRMRQVAVNPGHQGQGIGRELVGFCEEVASQRGFREIVLHARESCLAFYLKLEYSAEGERFEELGIPHVQMRKLLHIR